MPDFITNGLHIGGGFGSLTCLWQPSYGLSDTTLCNGFWTKTDKDINYYLTVTDEKGCSITASPYYYVDVFNLSVGDILQTENIKVYPNPTTEKVFIENLSHLQGSVSVLDITGRVLSGATPLLPKTTQIDLNGFAPGTYLLKVIYKGGMAKTYTIIKK